MNKFNTTDILYYLFLIIALILLTVSIFFNDNSHGLLVGIIIIGLAVLRKIR